MESLLVVGFVFGLKHALEGDHFAAVASLATQSNTAWYTIRAGIIWGLGHTLTLFLVGGTVLMMGTAVPAMVALSLEWLVGLMLMILGGDVIRRVIKARIHFHVHQHDDGTRHFHAHGHAADNRPHDPGRHHHSHSREFPVRALLVGLVHGLAGSAALILLALASAESTIAGFTYILVFGLGSLIGMGTLSAIIAIPLQNARGLGWMYNGLCSAVGVLTFAIGLNLLYQITPMIIGMS